MIPRAQGPKAPMTRRTRGREIALQVLYQLEQNPGQGTDEVNRFIARRLREPKLCAFAHALVDGVLEHQLRIDALISEVAENWRLDRMAAIDRNILRLGAYELLYCDEVPTKVAINEALELAKRYSTAQSSRFVNGILDRLQSAGAAQVAKEAAEEIKEAEEAMTTVETEGLGGLALDVVETPVPEPTDLPTLEESPPGHPAAEDL
jgi:transcription antitermination protein NusB